MKNLIVIRHAKSSWDAPLKDIDRPLDNRGIKDAHRIALRAVKHLPKTFLMFSSTAKRASETAIIFAQNFLYPIENIVFKEELYTFDENNLERIVKSLNNKYDNVILFGHNEAITNFVNKFGNIFIENVPTSGFVSLKFDSDNWQFIDRGRTIKTLFPKDLK
ncbi:MAG TPA: histidine phosphatase family protein [Bacteroidia bacterium]|jgi:phosphohistidine phosphatase|nr:histidine phosphatase family protein [Bacteroidia bacterium]